ncbi:hypothetical protein SAMN05216480_101523 [Pustulibacterium marinum]|uniref:Uncharacterized protein n=1 Tax=Pustulibacterium marinum TaxID=1224947 RepID=A0A1I7F164_9FLAO|nr:DUF6691 family protein [Pustulibacterium marinum]SFU29894.1 hypothetical protein SAMN05216480_101523 [Pustulibacterium marinum]
MKRIVLLIIGIVFGIIMYKSEAASWFRIYEMFRFESIHMYGIMGVAVGFGILFVQLIKRFNIKSVDGEPIKIAPKEKSFTRYMVGGIIFGLGWALVGACPGPIFVMIGAGFVPMLIVFIGALIGTYIYGVLRDKLPH